MPTPTVENNIPSDIHVHVAEADYHRMVQTDEYRRQRDAKEEKRYQDLMKQPITLSSAQKLISIMLVIVMGYVSVAGTYLMFRAQTDLRLVDLEKTIERHNTAINYMERHGFDLHETRITHLEAKAETQQQVISDIKAKLDTLSEILVRIERSVNEIQARHDKP